MIRKNDGGCAFPVPVGGHGTLSHGPGMSLRDYFAAQALVALINHPGAADCTPKEIASDAYLYADAMIRERDR